MAVIRHTNFDKKVQTVAERNAINPKVDGMIVVVNDAIADVNAGAGKAVYRWDATDSSWIMLSKSTYETISFATEEITIVNGKVLATNIPTDNEIWSISIIDGNQEIAFPRVEDLSISVGTVDLLTNNYNGKKLRFSYAYGSISQQLNAVLDAKEDKINIEIGSY